MVQQAFRWRMGGWPLLMCAVFHSATQLVGAQNGTESSPAECYANETQPYSLFATKTSYFAVDDEDEDPISIEGCETMSFWLLARHGTRNPGDDSILAMGERGPKLQARIVQAHNSGAGSLCALDIDNLSTWSFGLTPEQESILTESGRREMVEIARRFRERFPQILKQDFDETKHQFRHTHKERAEESAKAYAQGAFPDQEVVIPSALDDDPLLRYYDFCTQWINQVDENQSTYEEQNLFAQSEWVSNVLRDVNERLGFTDLAHDTANEAPDLIEFDDVYVMYDLCRYERAFNPDDVSVWCAVFHQEDLEVLEYYEELKYWHKNGYGHELNYKMACPLLANVVDIFQNDTSVTGTFYFSHSEALLPFIALLDLFHDPDPLRHDNFIEMQGRQYRTSFIGSFSTNLAFALLECQAEPTHRLLTYHQEKRIKLPKCDQDPCHWEQFLQQYQSDIDCQFEEICGLPTPTTIGDHVPPSGSPPAPTTTTATLSEIETEPAESSAHPPEPTEGATEPEPESSETSESVSASPSPASSSSSSTTLAALLEASAEAEGEELKSSSTSITLCKILLPALFLTSSFARSHL